LLNELVVTATKERSSLALLQIAVLCSPILPRLNCN